MRAATVNGRSKDRLWPTGNVNLITALVVVAVVAPFIVSYRLTWELRSFSAWTFDNGRYWDQIVDDGFLIALFVLYTIEIAATLGVVAYHLTVTHHPKFYVSRRNRLSILAHITGGTTAILALYAAVVTGSKILVLIACAGGVLGHFPSVIWQMRNVHGNREIIIPAYVAIGSILVVLYFNVLTTDASLETVISLGMTLSIFTWVRLFGALGQWDAKESHDRSLLFAGLVKAPFIAGPFGPFMVVGAIVVWNLLFTWLKPVPREFLQINRGYNDVFPAGFRPGGPEFRDVLAEHEAVYANKQEAVAHAAFEMMSADGVNIRLGSVVELLESWGLPDAEEAGRSLFARADVDHDERVTYDEFKARMWFIWESIYEKGEMAG